MSWLTQNKLGLSLAGLCLGAAWWVGKQDGTHYFGADSVPCEDCEHYTCISIRKIMDENKEFGADGHHPQSTKCVWCFRDFNPNREQHFEHSGMYMHHECGFSCINSWILKYQGDPRFGAEEFGAEHPCVICGTSEERACCWDSDEVWDGDGFVSPICRLCCEIPIDEHHLHNREMWGAEEFGAEPFICPECQRESTKSKNSQVCVSCESEYQSGRNPPMNVPWPNGVGYYAEEFGADDEDKVDRILQLLQVVQRKATGSNAAYAKTYANAAMDSYYQYGMDGLKTQIAYVLSNLGGWRGDEARKVKAELRKLGK